MTASPAPSVFLVTALVTNHSVVRIGGVCAPDAPVPRSVWGTVKKAMEQELKDIQQAYH